MRSAEVYSQQANPAFEAELATRTALRHAAFFAPHLRSGMRLLDVGCGPGSITLGLAQTVTPGEVVGIDLQPALIERARAAARGVANLRFEVGDIYRLAFADGSFDAVFANGVLMHLAEPLRALAELRRVLCPGGVAGVRDPDFGAALYAPSTPLLDQWFALRVRVRQHNGGDPFLARHYRRLLLVAGFLRAEASASIDYAGSRDATRRHAACLNAMLQGIARTALAQGWIEPSAVRATAAEIDAWAERPDAFAVTTWCQALGWT